MNKKDRTIIALDFPNKEVVAEFLAKFDGVPADQKIRFVKVGMELYYAEGPEIVKYIKDLGFKVFVDLKVHDIPNTAKGAVSSLARLGADITNVHATGGIKMMQAAKEALDSVTESLAEQMHDLRSEDQGSLGDSNDPRMNECNSIVALDKPLLIGVTQLTSTDSEMMNTELQISGEVQDSVLHLASNVNKAGLDGIVCSALEVPEVKKAVGKDFLTICPGVRPKVAGQVQNVGDQKRVVSPDEAFELGADYIVVGRAVTKAKDPVAAFNSLFAKELV